MNKLISLLKKNPEVLSTYVACGIAATTVIVSALDQFTRHLLTVQGIDPATQPGQPFRSLLAGLFDEVPDEEELDDSYNNEVLEKYFTRARSKWDRMTLGQYKEMTDLTNLEEPSEVVSIQPLEEFLAKINSLSKPLRETSDDQSTGRGTFSSSRGFEVSKKVSRTVQDNEKE